MRNKTFNLVIVGVGGQGQITLLKILAEAALIENYDLKTSELHGLSQRGGSVEVHIRFAPRPKFGVGVWSPLVSQAGADLILALEPQEALRALYYSFPKTKFLINKFIFPIPGEVSIEENQILKEIKKITPEKIEIVEATKICKEKLGNEILAGIYLISLATFKNLIPLKPKSILKAIKKIIPEKYLELNEKTFNLAKQDE